MDTMDINTLRGLSTLLVLLAFVGVVVWAYSGKRRDAFEEAAKLPFADEGDFGVAARSLHADNGDSGVAARPPLADNGDSGVAARPPLADKSNSGVAARSPLANDDNTAEARHELARQGQSDRMGRAES